jgi:hypothetical protein
MITPSASFKDNLAALPAITDIARIELRNASGATIASIENQPGKQGSLAVYNYLNAQFGALNAQAAEHGLAVFAEHTPDAQARPGAHPNIDRLIEIAAGGAALDILVIPA